MQSLPQGTVTFLFTDIAGSTRLWQEQSSTMPAAYARHDAILREATQNERGVVFKVVGDAFQIAFPTAAGGVLAALRMQQALAREPWPLPEPLRVRMALHTGAVDPDQEGDYRSPVLNRLGRLLGAGHGGQVLVSQATMELAREHLPEETRFLDLGEHRLKDFSRPERVYQLLADGLAAEFPALKTLDARPNNLPAQSTPFIGREDDMAAVGQLLWRPDVRLVTLTGPGGIGKTRLSLQVAANVRDVFEDGIFVVNLASISDPSLIPGEIGQVLGLAEGSGPSPGSEVIDHLHERHILLVLDNLEQVVDVAPFLDELLTSCPRVSLLATSRIRLHLRREQEYPVRPLELPDDSVSLDPGTLLENESVRLFVDRASAVRPRFELDKANASVIARICARLDGLPLAIELAASRIRMLPPAALLGRLTERLSLLAGGPRDLPTRQQTLRATIDWSYTLLSPQESKLFRLLSVFVGGASLEAIETVAFSVDSSADTFATLERLLDHNLVRQVSDADLPRFSMLETIREYGQEQLEKAEEKMGAESHHSRYFLKVVEEAEPHLASGSNRSEWLAMLETDHDNIRAAMGWAVQHDSDLAMQFAASLGYFWNYGDHLREGQAWLTRILELSGSLDGSEPVHARSWTNASYLAWSLGEYSEALRLAEQAISYARASGERALIADALRSAGGAAMDMGEWDRAEAWQEEALALYRTVGDQRRTVIQLNNIGVSLYLGGGDLVRALARLDEALSGAREIGDALLTGHILLNVAELARDYVVDHVHAAGLYREALDLLLSANNRTVLAHGMAAVGILASLQEMDDAAARFAGVTEGISRDIGASIPRTEQVKAGAARIASIARMGADRYIEEHQAGMALPIEDGVQEAIAVMDLITAGGDLTATGSTGRRS